MGQSRGLNATAVRRKKIYMIQVKELKKCAQVSQIPEGKVMN